MSTLATNSNPVLGLIAGQGRLPFLVARGARAAGLRVVCAALQNQADPALAAEVHRFFRVPLARPGAWIRKLRRAGASRTIMVGHVAKRRIYTPWRLLRYLPDWRALRIWYRRLRGKDKRNDTLLAALADELAAAGIILENSVQYCQEHLARTGIMTRCQPAAAVQADLAFGFPLAKEIARLDIGQAIAVKEREVIAVEALEGTDEMIQRAARLCPSGGWTLIKVAKPHQDPRFDVPTVGPDTLQNLKNHGAACLAVEAGCVLILDLPDSLALADRLKIPLVGYLP